MQLTSRNTSNNYYQTKICVVLQENLYISSNGSKVIRPLIESHITALVIPPELQTSKTVKTAVLFFHFNFILFLIFTH